jgi:hypothetical protein
VSWLKIWLSTPSIPSHVASQFSLVPAFGAGVETLLTSSFMEHVTLAGRIRWADYRPFLLTIYGNLCFTTDSGDRYAPEDTLIAGSFAGESAGWTWSAVVNSSTGPWSVEGSLRNSLLAPSPGFVGRNSGALA